MNVYLDNAATTSMLPEVIDTMKSYMTEYYGNPSGLYSVGFKVKNILDDCRKTIAQTINVSPKQIYFTSGGTEGDNWVIKGVAEAL